MAVGGALELVAEAYSCEGVKHHSHSQQSRRPVACSVVAAANVAAANLVLPAVDQQSALSAQCLT